MRNDTLTFLMLIRTAWDDYFTVSNPNHYTSRQTLSGAKVYVSNSIFVSITSTSNGGALYCASVTYLLVESTSFFSCKTSDCNGGAIYFINSGGQCALYGLCGNDCYSTYSSSYSTGQFSRIDVSNTASSKNYVNYSSIARSVNENSGSLNTLCNLYGKICCPSVNISLNKCNGRSGIYCEPYCDSNSVTCSISHSTFADNNAKFETCLFLMKIGANFEIKSCNIIRNTQSRSSSEGTIATWGNLIINDSCILENNAFYNFFQGSSYTITVSNCTVDSTSNNGYLITQNTVTKSFIHALNHISTQNCHSEYDSVGNLTPIIQSSKQLIHCCTCGLFFNLPQSNEAISLISLLVFNFIHPYASNNPLF
jgi:hypothetical protein